MSEFALVLAAESASDMWYASHTARILKCCRACESRLATVKQSVSESARCFQRCVGSGGACCSTQHADLCQQRSDIYYDPDSGKLWSYLLGGCVRNPTRPASPISTWTCFIFEYTIGSQSIPNAETQGGASGSYKYNYRHIRYMDSTPFCLRVSLIDMFS
jgi:hypothetical protein